MQTIYLDTASTTKIDHRVLAEMMPYLIEQYGNPSSIYSLGKATHNAIEKARKQVAKAINAEPNQIFFTSGATESNNWVCSNFKSVLCSPYEHHSILKRPHTTEMRTFAPLANDIIRYSADLVSHMWINNEIGEIYDIADVAKISHEMGILFHTDATQAFGHIPINVKELDCDFLSLSGHKFHSPKGIGILYIKEPDKFAPLLYGGQQEVNHRAGTENVASIIGMGKAAEIYNYSPKRDKRCREIQNKFIEAFSFWQDVYFNTDIAHSVSTILNISFKGVAGETLLLLLDRDGICISAGSACNSRSMEPSHVLKAIGTPEEYLFNSIRLSWDDTLTEEEIGYTIESIKNNVMKVRGYI